MKKLNLSNGIISCITLCLMLFSPLVAVRAEEVATTQPETQLTETSASPLPARGVDYSKIGPQPIQENVTPSVPITESTVAEPIESTETGGNLGNNASNPNNIVVGAGANTIENSDTGANSENTTTIEEKNNTSIETNNESEVVNNIRGIVGTGGNIAMGQRGHIDIQTGDALAALNLINLINTIFAGLMGGEVQFVYKDVSGDFNENFIIDPVTGNVTDLNGNPIVINSDTGENSLNNASNNFENNTDIKTNNLADLLNKITLRADTGDNAIDNNVGNNLIQTGDADVSLNLLNFLNSTFVVGDFGVVGLLNILGDWTGNLLLPKSIFGNASGSNVTVTNKDTGTNSLNNAESASENETTIDTSNNAEINNNINLNGNTGGNEIESNVGNSSIFTGGVNLMLNAKNFANITMIGDVIYFAFVNVLGEWNGADLISKIFGFNQPTENILTTSNTNTGENSDNSATNSQQNETDISTNNGGSITNLIEILANTGDNKISGQRGNSTIETGDINVLSNILNFINTNIYGKRVVLLFVNVFGDWTGNIDFLSENAPEQEVKVEETNGKSISLTNLKQSKIKFTRILNEKTATGEGEVSETIKNNDEEKSVIANSTDSNDSIALGVSENVPAEFVASKINFIIIGLMILYIAAVVLYSRAVKKTRSNY